MRESVIQAKKPTTDTLPNQNLEETSPAVVLKKIVQKTWTKILRKFFSDYNADNKIQHSQNSSNKTTSWQKIGSNQTRSMVDAQCNEDQTANPPEQQPVPDATNNPASTTENSNTNPQNSASNPTVELTRMETT